MAAGARHFPFDREPILFLVHHNSRGRFDIARMFLKLLLIVTTQAKLRHFFFKKLLVIRRMRRMTIDAFALLERRVQCLTSLCRFIVVAVAAEFVDFSGKPHFSLARYFMAGVAAARFKRIMQVFL